LILTLLAGILLWLLKGPLFRYGYGYLVFYCLLSLSYVIYYFLKDFRSEYVALAIMTFLFYATVYYYDNLSAAIKKDFFSNLPAIKTQPFTRQEVKNGLFINLVDSDGVDHTPLPSACKNIFNHLKPTYRGNNISDGFIHQ
jgi:hypothetical protein